MQCIETTDPRSKGYGHQRVQVGWYAGYEVYAHRAAYALAWGPIPKGMYVRHACHNPGCINPLHLMVGTHADNMRDMSLSGRGSKHLAKITQEQADEIRSLSKINQHKIKKQYKITQHTVSRIRSGLIWKG